MDPRDDQRRPAIRDREPSRRPSGALIFLLAVSAVVIGFAALVAVWMYWLGGFVPG